MTRKRPRPTPAPAAPQAQRPEMAGQPQVSLGEEEQARTWLHQQILATLGEQGAALIESSHAHGSRGLLWICEQLGERGYAELAEGYEQRRRAMRVPEEETEQADG